MDSIQSNVDLLVSSLLSPCSVNKVLKKFGVDSWQFAVCVRLRYNRTPSSAIRQRVHAKIKILNAGARKGTGEGSTNSDSGQLLGDIAHSARPGRRSRVAQIDRAVESAAAVSCHPTDRFINFYNGFVIGSQYSSNYLLIFKVAVVVALYGILRSG